MIDQIIPAAVVSAAVVGASGATAAASAASFARTAGTAFVATVRSPQMLGTLAGTGALYLGVTALAGGALVGGIYVATHGPSVARRTASFAARQFKKLRTANDGTAIAEPIPAGSATFAKPARAPSTVVDDLAHAA